MTHVASIPAVPPNLGAQQLQAWRRRDPDRPVTQRRLSDDTGIHEQTLSLYERGVHLPNRKHALILEQVAGIDPSAWDQPAHVDHVTTTAHGGQ